MTARTKNILVQTIGTGLAVGLLYLALRNVDFEGMWTTLREANYWWLVPMLGSTLVAHFLRAWRWRMFLDALPPSKSSAPGARVALTTAFNSVMIGYLLNMVVPRLGEVARAADLSAHSGLKFSSVFGTVVIERILDFVALLLILAGVGYILIESPAAEQFLFAPLRDRLGTLTTGKILTGAVVLAASGVLVFGINRFLQSREAESGGLGARIAPIIESFKLGLVSLFTSPHRTGITVTTISIWFCYWLMLYLPLYMLDMIEPYNLDMATGFVLLGIGSIGFVLPAPGGIGSFHYFVIQTLVQIYAIPNDIAAGFAVLTHTAQVILLTTVGFACLVLQGSSFSSILRAARDVEDRGPDEPILKTGTN